MKTAFLAVVLIGSVVLGTHEVQAQAYGSYYYPPSWNGAPYQGYAQEYDPYYELHVLHYQSYIYRNTSLTRHTHPAALQQVLTSHGWSPPIIPPPQLIISPRPPAPMRRR